MIMIYGNMFDQKFRRRLNSTDVVVWDSMDRRTSVHWGYNGGVMTAMRNLTSCGDIILNIRML